MNKYKVEMKYVSTRNWNVLLTDVYGNVKDAERNISREKARKTTKRWTVNLKERGLYAGNN